MDNSTTLLAVYLAEHHLDRPGHDHPMFFNQHGTKLSRGAIAWIIGKHQATTDDPPLADAERIMRSARPPTPPSPGPTGQHCA
jgi:integrase/recombinase XerD